MISHSQGNFQRDSAFLTLKGCHYTRSRPAMATGRPLVISLARYATPIRQYSVSPPSFAARGVRPLMPRIVGWCSTGGILHTVGAAAAPPLPRPCEGGWKRNLADMGKYLSVFIIPQYIRFNQDIIHNILCFKMGGGTPLLCSLRVAEHTQQTLPKHQEHHHAYFYLPSYTRKGS